MGRKAKPIGLHIVEGNGSRLTKKEIHSSGSRRSAVSRHGSHSTTPLAMVEYTNNSAETNRVPHPLLTKKKQLHEQMKSLAVEFGLTPSSRARLAMPQKKKWKGLKNRLSSFLDSLSG
ncbi:phage terminase, small subunit, putative, P27 family [Marininema mesophilum]|uniref:Phage terminase, small subunit, putative, P27 family n=1 Tax=Marininema mesophilum TaxID=1048340 RepID=A0A1H2YLG5_9BACL|nr:phage terminase, small subunit, putative, P27 family [Marininema mesophilum]